MHPTSLRVSTAERWFFVKIRSRTKLASLLAATALLLTACTSSDVKKYDDNADSLGGELSESIDDAVIQAMGLSHSSQAVVGVWTADGERVQAYTTDDAPSTEIDANALFRGAQTTQPVMCALLLDMVNEGLVSLDREVAVDLPRQTGIGDVTYGQLCDGTSGLADFKKGISDIYITNPTRHWSTGEKIAASLIRDELSWPGLDVHRSDSNAVLLGRALSVVADEPLRRLLRDRVYLPAGMNSSYYPDSEQLTIEDENHLTGASYLPGPNCEADPVTLTEVSPSILGGAGATVTTAGDLQRFYTHYLEGGFGGAHADVITETKPTKNPERDDNGEPTEEVAEGGVQRGFGVLNHGELWGFDGSMPGTISAAWTNPETGFTVVVALNNSTAGAGFASNLAKQLAAITGDAGEHWTAEDMGAALAEAAVCAE